MNINIGLLWKDIKKSAPAICAVVSYILIMLHQFGTPCPLMILFGFPCPACGMSRAGFNLLRFHIVRAFHFHPFIYGVGLLFIIWFVFRYIKEAPFPYWKQCFILLGIGMMAFYIYRMIYYFPDRIPMLYQSNNVVHHLLSLGL